MSLLKHIKSVQDNLAPKNKQQYVTNSLAEIKLSKNAFNACCVFDDKNSNEYLALNNPIQFIFRYLNAKTIDNAIKSNATIENLLRDYNLTCDYSLENASSIIVSHLVPTARLAHRMFYNINVNPSFDDYAVLIQSALLHDIGKIFIPKKILNKKTKLSLSERRIIELHNRLSYEILKTTNLKPQVAHLAWEHHNYDNCFKKTILNQILTIADIYCALREVRPYKKAHSDIAAKIMLYDMGANGMFDVSYIRYLCK